MSPTSEVAYLDYIYVAFRDSLNLTIFLYEIPKMTDRIFKVITFLHQILYTKEVIVKIK